MRGARLLPRCLSLLALGCVLAAGCGGRRTTQTPLLEPVVESGSLVELGAGGLFRFVDHFRGGKPPPGLRRSADGEWRIALGEAHQPALAAPTPYVIRQKVRLPQSAMLRTGYGLVGEPDKARDQRVQFSIRMQYGGRVVELFSAEVRPGSAPDSGNWSTITVDLAEAAGQQVQIELATEALGPSPARPSDADVGSLAVWVNPTLLAPAEARRPNIVLFVIDGLRPDHLGCYGYDRQTSPFLDQMAREGVLFLDATAQATWTLASVASLLSSSYRIVRGSHPEIMAKVGQGINEEASTFQPVAMPTSLQSELRKAGYVTLACVGGGFLDASLGFDSGFDWYWCARSLPALPDQLSVVRQHLSVDPQAPFLLFFHTYEVHNYFQGWGHCLEEFSRGYSGALTDRQRLEEACLRGTPDRLSPDDRQYIQDLYDGEILHTDRQVRAFLGWLLARPWGKDTILVVTSDHGEGLGDHGAMSHGSTPYQSVARVPLIMRLPDGRCAGQTVAQPVALTDLMPTLLEIAGVEAPRGIAGQSLLPLLEGDGYDGPWPIFSESRGADLLARKGRWCYIARRGEGKEELYDIARDSDETDDVATSQPAQIAHMRQVLGQLVMKAVRGCHLAVMGPRPKELVLELACDGGLSYLAVPTLLEGDLVSVTKPIATSASGRGSGTSPGCRLEIRLAAGANPHAILFEPEDPRSTVLVSATLGGEPVGAARFHLGREQKPVGEMPIPIGRAATPMLLCDEPPVPERPDTWGIWIWLPRTAAWARRADTTAAQTVPDELREQLHALGYLR